MPSKFGASPTSTLNSGPLKKPNQGLAILRKAGFQQTQFTASPKCARSGGRCVHRSPVLARLASLAARWPCSPEHGARPSGPQSRPSAPAPPQAGVSRLRSCGQEAVHAAPLALALPSVLWVSVPVVEAPIPAWNTSRASTARVRFPFMATPTGPAPRTGDRPQTLPTPRRQQPDAIQLRRLHTPSPRQARLRAAHHPPRPRGRPLNTLRTRPLESSRQSCSPDDVEIVSPFEHGIAPALGDEYYGKVPGFAAVCSAGPRTGRGVDSPSPTFSTCCGRVIPCAGCGRCGKNGNTHFR